jgi:hypothetical protein
MGIWVQEAQQQGSNGIIRVERCAFSLDSLIITGETSVETRAFARCKCEGNSDSGKDGVEGAANDKV